jgi:hypothetical protein
VTFTDKVPEPAPSGGLAEAASRALSHNPAASSSATNGAARSTSSLLASPVVLTTSSITDVSPSLFATPLTTTAPPAASAPTTAPSAVNPPGPSSAPATAQTLGQSLLVSQEQVRWSAHLGQEDGLEDSEATGSAVDGKKQAERFVKITEKPRATAPTTAPEQRQEQEPGPEPEAKLVPIIPDNSVEPVLDTLDYGFLTASFGAGSDRPESAPKEPGSSPGFWAMLGSAALSAAHRARHTGSPISTPTLRSKKPNRNINHEL